MMSIKVLLLALLATFAHLRATVAASETVAGEEQPTERLLSGTLWHSYLEINPAARYADITSIEQFAAQVNSNVLPFGEKDIYPNAGSWKEGLNKFRGYMRNHATTSAKRSLIIYHVEGSATSLSTRSVATNNLKLFLSSVHRHQNSSGQEAFYLFNTVDGDSEAQKLIPSEKANIALVQWSYAPNSLFSFLHTLKLLDADAITSVDMVVSLSTVARGPLDHIQDGQWIGKFGSLLDNSGVGLVGSMISCDGSPHVQTHAFAVKSSLVPQLLLELERYYLTETHVPMEDYFQFRLTRAVQESNFLISSLYHAGISGTGHFQASSCARVTADSEPIPSCAPQPTGVIFQRWSGESLGAKGYVCGRSSAMNPEAQASMRNLTLALTRKPTKPGSSLPGALQPVFPEHVDGGPLSELYAEYALESLRLQNPRKLASDALRAAKNRASQRDNTDDFVATDSSAVAAKEAQVCFLVRTAAMHDPSFASGASGKIKYVEMDLDVLARSLLMQTNGNWQAYFIITDPSPFEARLQEILAAYNDPRLAYFQVDMRYRPKFTVVDAGYTTTDYVLNALLARKECKWVSATNGDNAYGSEVVERILSASHAQGSTKQPDMLLLPMDSRNFADQDYILREDRTWDRRCVGIDATSALFQLASTAGSMPKVGRVDLAAIVLNREKLLAENVRFGNFSDPSRFRCLGCNDGYFAQYLVRSLGWTYTRLPVDGLRSLMFHGPSPTHCIAAGNVWFDHPQVNKVGCLSQETVRKILLKDSRRDKGQRVFDAKHFAEGDNICLRLNKYGHQSKSLIPGQRRLASTPHHENLPGRRELATIPESELSDNPRVFSLRHPRGEYAPGQCDWRMYLMLNPDLPANNITLADAEAHYTRVGKSENRECNFSWKFYLWANPDLVDAGITTEAKAVQHYSCCGKPEGRLHRTFDGFDWIAYLEINSDLYGKGLRTKYDALIHYRNSGKGEFRSFVPSVPSAGSWQAAAQKFSAYWASCAGCAGKRNLIVYHVEDVGVTDDALDLTVNNVKVFLLALMHHASTSSASQRAFYWFNVAGLMENPIRKLIPADLPNVAVVDWAIAPSPFYSFVQTLRQFDPRMLTSVDAIFSTSSGVRGPLHRVEGGAWVAEFRRLLDANNVGLVGPIISCEGGAHVQNHMFAIRPAVVPLILQELVPYNDVDVFVPIQEHFVTRLAGVVLEAGQEIASLVHSKRLNIDHLTNATCVNAFATTAKTGDACKVRPDEALFLRWSGESWGAKGFVCGKGVAMEKKARDEVILLTKAVADSAKLLPGKKIPSAWMPVLPEAPTGWLIYEEFNRELGLQPSAADRAVLRQENAAVCFLVNVQKSQDRVAAASQRAGMYETRSVQNLLRDFSVQTLGAWRAFLYAETGDFEPRLSEVVKEADDARVAFVPVTGAVPSRLDAALGTVLGRSECRWVTFTEGDMAYGSEVVERVLTASSLPDSARQPDMLLLPMDSLAYAQLDNRRRGALSWKDRCMGIDTMISLYQMSYTVQPVPEPGRVFAPSLFLNRQKLASEKILPGATTMPKAYMCPSCDAGYFAKHLVRHRGWSYARLPLDGLRSAVFDHPSPTHCIAAGNVWFDHPCPEKAGCVSYGTVRRLRGTDQARNVSYLDWDRFYSTDQICLRFAESAHGSQTCQKTILL